MPSILTLQAWLKDVNARGGIDGRMVELLVGDDGGDPARHRSLVQDMVERQKIVAFVQENGVITARPSRDYIEAKRIPVIGTDTGSEWVYDSPMYFPQATSGRAIGRFMIYGAAAQMLPEGKRKLGWVVCVEVAACQEYDSDFQEHAPKAGFEPVYRGKIGLTQPDYTAECLAARQAGVEVMIFFADSLSLERFVASCSRQGFHPTYASNGQVLAPRLKDNPNLENFVGVLNLYPPYFPDESGNRTAAEFQRVMAQYQPKTAPEPGNTLGWASAKLLERAAVGLPEPPTSEAILRNLWSIKNEDLGGYTAPLTFAENLPAPRTECWFTVRIRGGKWVSPDAFARKCRP